MVSENERYGKLITCYVVGRKNRCKLWHCKCDCGNEIDGMYYLHKLSYEDTNCITLFSVVYPEKNYEIVDGVMKVKADYITCTSPIVGSLTSKIMCACDDAISINA